MAARFLFFLSFLSVHATWVLAGGIFLGVAWPALAAAAAPLLAPSVFILLTAALVRLDWHAVLTFGRRPGPVLLLVLWLLLVSPVLMAGLMHVIEPPRSLATAIVLAAACPPIMASIAFALLFRLDAALAAVIVFATSLLAPLTLPPLALVLLGLDLEIDVGEFMLRLGAIVGGAVLAGITIRALVARRTVDAHAAAIDGGAVIMLLVFAVAIMDGVTEAALHRPGFVALTVAAAFLVNMAMQAAGAAAFWWMGRTQAVSAGLMTGNRNMGLLLAALAGTAEFDVVLYFAVGQLPIYILPALLKPLYWRLMGISK